MLGRRGEVGGETDSRFGDLDKAGGGREMALPWREWPRDGAGEGGVWLVRRSESEGACLEGKADCGGYGGYGVECGGAKLSLGAEDRLILDFVQAISWLLFSLLCQIGIDGSYGYRVVLTNRNQFKDKRSVAAE